VTRRDELEAALARAHAAEAKVEALEIRLGMRPPKPVPSISNERPVVRPKHFVVERGADDLTISWRSSPDVFLCVFSLMWNGVLVFAFVDAGHAMLAKPWAFLFMLPFVIAGVVVGMHALASVINRTTIWTHDGLLEVRARPIKMTARRVVATNDVQQLHSVKDDETYKLTAVLGDDRQRTLVSGLTDDESRFLEVAFEEHLDIEHRPRES
jgi:hypothetical protein